MIKSIESFLKAIPSELIFLCSITNAAFWILANKIDVYHHTILGAIFELVSLPMAAGSFLLPIVSLILWYKEGFKLKSFYPFSALIPISAILYLACF